MAWFEKEMSFAGEKLTEAAKNSIALAGDRLGEVVQAGATQIGAELRDVVQTTSQEIDAKLDMISAELHDQRQFTKDDVRELVDYAADRFSGALDERMAVARQQISDLVEEKVEYFKVEVDQFFIQRQRDLARERHRLWWNVFFAVLTSILVGVVSWFYQHVERGELDLFAIFRIVMASLTGGYAVYLLVKMVLRWRSMSEHRKDVMFLTMRYWGVLRPENMFMNVLLLVLMVLGLQLFLFPQWLLRLPGGDELLRVLRDMFPHLHW
uniref:Uncharacterized protein n=1 Tax=mine drainage metagenome TaxID=410659 RepID=E6QQZ1_9ZZZZ